MKEEDEAKWRKTIAAALQYAYAPVQCEARDAELLLTFFQAANLVPHFKCCDPRSHSLEFLTGDTRWSIENADSPSFAISYPSNNIFNHDGTWLDRAPLNYLLDTIKIGEDTLGTNWLKTFRKSLRNPYEMLDTLNEIWWTAFWRDISSLKHSHVQSLTSNKDIDWRFHSAKAGIWFNVEVKRRPIHSLRISHSESELRALNKGHLPSGLFDAISDKFSPSSPDELNVAAVTIYGGVTDDICRTVDDWFRCEQSQHVDAIVLFSMYGIKTTFRRTRKHQTQLDSCLDDIALEKFSNRYPAVQRGPTSILEAVRTPARPI